MTAPPISASYTEPTSVLGKNLWQLRQMLADVFHMRAMLGAENQAEALARIYLGCLPRAAAATGIYTVAELNQYRPFAIIGPSPNLAIRSRQETFGGIWQHGRQGEFDIMLERQHPTGGLDDVNDLAWMDLVDKIRQTNDTDKPGLLELHETAGHLILRQVDLLEIYRGEEEEINSLGDYQRARIRVYWGRI